MHNVAVRPVDALLAEVHSDSDDSPDASCRVEQLLQDSSDDDDELPTQVNPHPAHHPIPHRSPPPLRLYTLGTQSRAVRSVSHCLPSRLCHPRRGRMRLPHHAAIYATNRQSPSLTAVSLAQSQTLTRRALNRVQQCVVGCVPLTARGEHAEAPTDPHLTPSRQASARAPAAVPTPLTPQTPHALTPALLFDSLCSRDPAGGSLCMAKPAGLRSRISCSSAHGVGRV